MFQMRKILLMLLKKQMIIQVVLIFFVQMLGLEANLVFLKQLHLIGK